MKGQFPIHLQFSTESGMASAAIRFLTWSEWSHVDMVLPDDSLLGARLDGGVQIRPKDYAVFSKKALYRVHCPTHIASMAIGRWKSQIGKPYDWTAILGFGFRQDWHQDGDWFCSEGIAWAFDLPEQHFSLVNRDLYRITPQTLAESTRLERIL